MKNKILDLTKDFDKSGVYRLLNNNIFFLRIFLAVFLPHENLPSKIYIVRLVGGRIDTDM